MYLHLFNGSEPVLLSIENSSYKPKLSLTCNQITVEAELTAADKETLIVALGGYTEDDLMNESE